MSPGLPEGQPPYIDSSESVGSNPDQIICSHLLTAKARPVDRFGCVRKTCSLLAKPVGRGLPTPAGGRVVSAISVSISVGALEVEGFFRAQATTAAGDRETRVCIALRSVGRRRPNALPKKGPRRAMTKKRAPHRSNVSAIARARPIICVQVFSACYLYFSSAQNEEMVSSPPNAAGIHRAIPR